MELKEAKSLYRAEGLKEPMILNAVMDKGYTLQFKAKRDIWVEEFLDRKAGGQRVFKTIDSAVAAANEIGLMRVVVITLP